MAPRIAIVLFGPRHRHGPFLPAAYPLLPSPAVTRENQPPMKAVHEFLLSFRPGWRTHGFPGRNPRWDAQTIDALVRVSAPASPQPWSEYCQALLSTWTLGVPAPGEEHLTAAGAKRGRTLLDLLGTFRIGVRDHLDDVGQNSADPMPQPHPAKGQRGTWEVLGRPSCCRGAVRQELGSQAR